MRLLSLKTHKRLRIKGIDFGTRPKIRMFFAHISNHNPQLFISRFKVKRFYIFKRDSRGIIYMDSGRCPCETIHFE